MSKRLIPQKSILTDRQAYPHYLKKCEDKSVKPVTINRFMDILDMYAILSADSLFKGNTVSLFGNMGTLYIERIKRFESNKAIDWKNSERGPDGKYVRIAYFEDDWYIRFKWKKPFTASREFSKYEFKACRGQDKSPSNLIKRLKTELERNPYLHLLFSVPKELVSIQQIDPVSGQVVAHFKSLSDLTVAFGNKQASIHKAFNTDKLVLGHRWKAVYENQL
jgi:hypothetical protein